MSMGKEYLDDLLIQEAILESEIKSYIDRKLWITKDNRILFIPGMSDRHIENTIKFIERKELEHLYGYIPVFRDELNKRIVIRQLRSKENE